MFSLLIFNPHSDILKYFKRIWFNIQPNAYMFVQWSIMIGNDIFLWYDYDYDFVVIIKITRGVKLEKHVKHWYG